MKLQQMIIEKNIENKKYIFVDCFDTIVWRILDSTNAENLCFEKIHKKMAINQNLLKQVWRQVKRIDLCMDGREERTFEELITEMHTRIGYYNYLKYTSGEFYGSCLSIYIAIEKSICRVNEEMLTLLQNIKKEKKRIFCISDFYLPKSAMEELFRYLKINDLFDEIYISSEVGKRKSKGSLYDYVIDDLAINPGEAIMIGDNINSDYKMAKKRGLAAYLYKKRFPVITENDLFQAYLNLYKNNCVQDRYLVNYVFFLHRFCAKLYNEIQQKDIKIVFFMAREGKFLKRLFDVYLKNVMKNSNIETVYFHVSRQATFLPSLGPLQEENFQVLRKDSPDISIRDFLENLNILKEFISHESIKVNVDLDCVIKDFFLSEEFNRLKRNKIFAEIYENNRLKQKMEILRYFKKIGLSNTEKITVVDIGWKGSIQDNISHLYGKKIKILGYYYGLCGNVTINENNIKEGLIFSNVPIKTHYFDTFRIRYRILERIAYASHGSCIGYCKGKPTLDLCRRSEEELFHFVEVIQNKIEEEFACLAELESEYVLLENSIDICLQGIYRVFCLDLDKDRLNQIQYMDKRMMINFGNRRHGGIRHKLEKRIKNLVKIFYYMDHVEKYQKLIIILYKLNLIPFAYLVKKIGLFMVKISLKINFKMKTFKEL